jgi:AraC-like DNA-binding protein
MIWDAKSMIAGCIDRMSRSACDGCERHDACASLLKVLRFDLPPKRRTERQGERASEPSKNPFLALLGQVARVIEGRVTAQKSVFRGEVERRMTPLLESGDVGMDRVARELGCGRQTLYRRLKAEGVTFEQVLDGLRRRLALRFVREPGVSVKELAYRLGYSDPAAFSRAFKRWTGRSPSDAQRSGSLGGSR